MTWLAWWFAQLHASALAGLDCLDAALDVYGTDVDQPVPYWPTEVTA